MRLTLRRKLLLVSLSLLALPWVGYRYLNEMEGFLRRAQEDALLTRAEAAAAVLASRPEPFAAHRRRVAGVADAHIHFVREMAHPVSVDGYAEEWRGWLDLARVYAPAPGYRAEHLLASHDDTLYALFKVVDDAIVYRAPGRGLEGDRLVLTAGAGPERRRYLLSTAAPGPISAYRLTASGRPGGWAPAIRGEWQESGGGYVIELRLSLHLADERLGFTLYDVDTLGGPETTVHTAGPAGGGVLLRPEPAIGRLVASLAATDTRAWVVDTGGRVLAVAGRLAPPGGRTAPDLTDRLLGLVVPTPAYDFSDTLADASKLAGREVAAALGGDAATRRRATADGRAVIASAAYPITLDAGIAGAVVVEQTTNTILSMQNRAFRRLAGSSLLALGLGLAVLLVLATRLSIRIRRLRDQGERAITADGRVVGTVGGSAAGDEIGDLARSFAGLLHRLGQYNRYLETMSHKLAHELRTPVVVVKSSLENLEHADSPEAAATYRRRAREGIDRLGTLLQRLSEATRLEQALQEAERERFDLDGLAAACLDGYRDAYRDRDFELDAGSGTEIDAAPDLVAQMLDKLVANAVDFAAPGTPVAIAVRRAGDRVRLEVTNQGPPLPAEMGERLFDSMVSVREGRGEAPHLGLGLYIVRMVAEFHGGRVAARNLPGGRVEFTVELPALVEG